MPTVIVNRENLFNAIGKKFTDEEFDQLCFEFGIELDGITSEKQMAENEQNKAIEGLSDEVLYKIEVPANRYDLQCLEGLTIALRKFLNPDYQVEFKISNPSKVEKFIVDENILKIRPYLCSAILRNITFDDQRIKGFMELQDKLHQNICRQRSLVTIGTHDYDTIKSPFYYRAMPPKDIKFIPLNRTQEMTGEYLINTELKNDPKLKNYLHLLNDFSGYPIVHDSNNVICALPPIINGNHTRITKNTKNVFIDVTAVDKTKANIVINTVVAMFSMYCEKPFEIEQVEIVLPDGSSYMSPDIKKTKFEANTEYLNKIAGTGNLADEEICKLLRKMSLDASVIKKGSISVLAPITRSGNCNFTNRYNSSM